MDRVLVNLAQNSLLELLLNLDLRPKAHEFSTKKKNRKKVSPSQLEP